MELPVADKLEIIEAEYNVLTEDKMREDVNSMCNLSQGILEKGEAKRETEIILVMYKNGYTLKQIASVTNKKVEEVGDIIKGNKPVSV